MCRFCWWLALFGHYINSAQQQCYAVSVACHCNRNHLMSITVVTPSRLQTCVVHWSLLSLSDFGECTGTSSSAFSVAGLAWGILQTNFSLLEHLLAETETVKGLQYIHVPYLCMWKHTFEKAAMIMMIYGSIAISYRTIKAWEQEIKLQLEHICSKPRHCNWLYSRERCLHTVSMKSWLPAWYDFCHQRKRKTGGWSMTDSVLYSHRNWLVT